MPLGCLRWGGGGGGGKVLKLLIDWALLKNKVDLN